jgi:Ca2+-binding EF-hand superfamily protein
MDHDGKISKEEFKAMSRLQKLPEEKQDRIFSRLDKDGDGALSRDEIGGFGRPRDGKPMRRLWELDTDKSGGISPDEFNRGQFFKKLPAAKREGMFRRLDTDGDGLITPKDKPEPPPNRDGKGKKGRKRDKGSKERDAAGLQARMIEGLDADGDGKLTFAEFRIGPPVKDFTEDEQEDLFEKLDRNHDHQISREDLPPPVSKTD